MPDSGARTQHAVQSAQRGAGVGQVHQAQGTQGDIEAAFGQRELLGVHALEPRLPEAQTRRTLPGGLHHRVRGVDTQHLALHTRERAVPGAEDVDEVRRRAVAEGDVARPGQHRRRRIAEQRAQGGPRCPTATAPACPSVAAHSGRAP